MGPCEVADCMAYFMVIFGVITFVCLLCSGPAPYGRHKQTAYRLEVPNKVAWLTQECSSCLIPLTFLVKSKTSLSLPLTLFLIHYGYRSFLYPAWLTKSNPTPALVWLAAVAFVTFNGTMQGLQHVYCRLPVVTPQRGVLGAMVWATGLLINITSDWKLQALKQIRPEAGYRIPYGGLFEYISCPNYFGETVEWVGFAIASKSWAAFAFAFFTFANLAPRAQHHHQWYQQQFQDFPKSRKAYIPLLW